MFTAKKKIMCGICGFIQYGKPTYSGNARIISGMNTKLVHRGPDAQDTLVFDNIAFGFSRLSIIGLANGMQPISNEEDSIILICNGEIFNYIEIKKQLKQKGHIFKTDSDVEVIIHLYEEHQMEFLNMLNGQFAFALYDKKLKTLFCARDQLGIIPLFYTFTGDTFIFGSEIKAILEYPGVSREVDIVGLDQVFTFAGLISPRTMFKNISSLENGCYLAVTNNGKIEKKEYWDLIYEEGLIELNGRKEEYYIDKLEDLFDTAVKYRLRADVPSGLYLSGGLDSSMIAMKVSQLVTGNTKEAFSIDFIESQISESVYQKLIADKSSTKLNQKIFFFRDISERLRQVIYHCECPLKETYNTASLSLSETVRNNGIKVILSGEGADEFFAGYVGYRFDKMRKMRLVENSSTPEEEVIRDRLWGDKFFFYERNFLDFDFEKKKLYSDAVNASFDEINCLNYQVINKDRLVNRDILNKRAYVDYKLRLVDHLVGDHGDRMAMANSVEVRYPFLDKDLVEFSARIPCELKLKEFTEKYILKRLAERFVPNPVVAREKFGFVAPGSPYLIQKNVEYINDLLSHSTIKRQGYFNPDEIDQLKKKYKQEGFKINAPFESDLLITVITFGILIEKYFQ